MIRMIRRRSRADHVNDTHADAHDDVSSADAAEGTAKREADAAGDIQSDAHDDPSSLDAAEEAAQPEADAAESAEAHPNRDDAQEDSPEEAEPSAAEPEAKSAGTRWQRVVAFGLLPGLAILIAGGAGYLRWIQLSARETQSARIESVQAATESTIKILSYSPDSVDHDLDAARDRLTGRFRDAYTQLTHDVVIPGSKEKKISAVATVPGATSVSASPDRAVVMVFVNQTIMVGNDPPSSTASTVRVTLDKHDNRWLIADFTPI